MANNKLLKLATLLLFSSVAITAQVASADEGAFCTNWSYNDPGCSAYLKPSGMKAGANEKAKVEAATCDDWSYNDPACSAYLKSSGMKAEAGEYTSGSPQVCTLGNFNATHC